MTALVFVPWLALLVAGVQALLRGAPRPAFLLGVSPLVVGLTVVAAGTSLPELATPAIASLRGEPELSVGNIVGSNVFNIMVVPGSAAVVALAGIEVSLAFVRFDIPVMSWPRSPVFPSSSPAASSAGGRGRSSWRTI